MTEIYPSSDEPQTNPYNWELAAFKDADDDTKALIRKELDRRFELQRRDSNALLMGLWFGLIVTLAFLVASVWVILAGHPVSGTILGSVDLVALVGIFVLRRFRP